MVLIPISSLSIDCEYKQKCIINKIAYVAKPLLHTDCKIPPFSVIYSKNITVHSLILGYLAPAQYVGTYFKEISVLDIALNKAKYNKDAAEIVKNNGHFC